MKLEVAKQTETNVFIVKTASCKNRYNGIVFIDFTETTPTHSPSQMMMM